MWSKTEIWGSQTFVESQKALPPQRLWKAVKKPFIKLPLKHQKMQVSSDLISKTSHFVARILRAHKILFGHLYKPTNSVSSKFRAFSDIESLTSYYEIHQKRQEVHINHLNEWMKRMYVLKCSNCRAMMMQQTGSPVTVLTICVFEVFVLCEHMQYRFDNLLPHLAQLIHRLVVEPCAHYVKRCHRQDHHHAADHAGSESNQPAVLRKHLGK